MNRSIMGYKMKITSKGNQYLVEVPTLGIKDKCEPLGAAIINIYKKTVKHIDDLERKSKTIPLPDNIQTYHGELQHRMVQVNRKISRFGFCLVADYMRKLDVEDVEKSIESFDFYKTPSKETYQQIEDDIGHALAGVVMLPANRAMMMTALIMHTDHVSKFSHLIEKAYMHLMTADFISVIMILTPVIEGILSSFIGHDPQSVDPIKKKRVYNKLAELEYLDNNKQMTHPYQFEEYIRCFIDLCDNVFFNTTDKAEESNYFNRHYIAHMAGNARFYSRNNALKIVLLLDLITIIIACSNGENYLSSKDPQDKDYQDRWNYYVLLSSMAISKFKGKEHNLLLQHKNFNDYL